MAAAMAAALKYVGGYVEKWPQRQCPSQPPYISVTELSGVKLTTLTNLGLSTKGYLNSLACTKSRLTLRGLTCKPVP